MVDYTTKLEVGERAIADYIAGKCSKDKLEEYLSSSLSACNFFNRNKNYKVHMCTESNKEPFFGMRIFPSQNKLLEIVEKTVVDEPPQDVVSSMWADIVDWEIEIDSRLLDRTQVNLNHKEAMACIIHEVGHSVYSDKIPVRFIRVLKGLKASMKSSSKAVIKMGYAIFMVPFAIGCIPEGIVHRSGRHEEYYADKIVKDCGYGAFLIAALDKIITAFGQKDPSSVENAENKKVETEIMWASRCMSDMTMRRNRLANDLFGRGAAHNSDYVKRICSEAMAVTGTNLRENYTGDAIESASDIYTIMKMGSVALEQYTPTIMSNKFAMWDSCIEAELNRDLYKYGTPAFEANASRIISRGLPSWRDVDRIQIEIDRMRNHTDRELVLDMIYKLQNEICEFMEACGDDPNLIVKYRPEAERMLDQLNQYRDLVLRRNNFDTKYRVFVKSPVGYEG